MTNQDQIEIEVMDELEVDLFADALDERLNAAAAGCISTIGSGSSISTSGSCIGCFGTIGSACTASSSSDVISDVMGE